MKWARVRIHKSRWIRTFCCLHTILIERFIDKLSCINQGGKKESHKNESDDPKGNQDSFEPWCFLIYLHVGQATV